MSGISSKASFVFAAVQVCFFLPMVPVGAEDVFMFGVGEIKPHK